MSSNSNGLFSGETGNQLAAQSLVKKLLTLDAAAGNDLINQLIQRKKFEVLAAAGMIIKADLEARLSPMQAIENEAKESFPTARATSVQSDLIACYSAISNNRGESFVPQTPELQDEASLQILKSLANKLIALVEESERVVAVVHKMESALQDAALQEKLNAEKSSSCALL
ncbi:hypothetical protein [Legionella sp. CNM-4043-24]|uniref:hypothetical protein n=1 Tax=Legionella sp. CNM-4043-24 TaxID=3421646 RepID=UPI00403ACC28